MPKVTIESDGKFASWLSSMRDLARTEAAIGLLSSKASAAHGDGVTNVDVGTWMEFGTTGPDGKVHVPSRPFLRSTLETRKESILKFASKRIRRALRGKSPPEIVFAEIGAYVVGQVQKRIASNTPPFEPLAESTLKARADRNKATAKALKEGEKAKRKNGKPLGSPKPLIDSGQLRSAISYEVRKR